MDRENWLKRVASTGLTVADAPIPETTPPILDAWRGVVSIEAEPVERISISLVNSLDEVDHRWLAHARQNTVFSEDGHFLLSVGGHGRWEHGWAYVQWSDSARLAPNFTQDDGNMEFLALSIDGRRVCAVTTEECDHWVVVNEIK